MPFCFKTQATISLSCRATNTEHPHLLSCVQSFCDVAYQSFQYIIWQNTEIRDWTVQDFATKACVPYTARQRFQRDQYVNSHLNYQFNVTITANKQARTDLRNFMAVIVHSKDLRNNNSRILACLHRPGLRCRRLQSTKDCGAPPPCPERRILRHNCASYYCASPNFSPLFL